MNIFRSFLNRFSFRQKVGYIAAGALAALILIPVATYAKYAHDISDPQRLMNRDDTGVVLLDKNGEPFFRFYQAKNQELIEAASLPEHVKEGLVATEDANFYNHPGFSLKSIAAAFYANASNKEIHKYGGSTLTQQLVKNVLLTPDKSFLRKYQELFLAIAIENHYNKEEILEMYLNSVYFGEGAFGIEAAGQTYFSKPAKDLTIAESSMLIGLLPAPSAYSPISGDLEMAKKRQELVLASMASEDYISETAKNKAANQKLRFSNDSGAGNNYAPHFALMVLQELKEKYGEETIARSGFKVKTTLNLDWQKQAEGYVEEHINSLRQNNVSNGSLVALDPKNGEIRVLVGSKDWDNSKFGKVNMALTPRQPGSSFKPIYYTEALNKKIITPATHFKDEPTDFGGGYRPENYDFRYRGDVSVRHSLSSSLNIPSIKVMEQLGVSESTKAAEKMGLQVNSSRDYGLSLALGTAEQPLLGMANAYAAFANKGQQHPPTAILSIQDKYQKPVYKNQTQIKKPISEEAAFLISSILSDKEARAPLVGHLPLEHTVALKTGTTEDNRDALTIGYTPNLVVGVWVGNNDHQPMHQVGSSVGALPIWIKAMQSFLKDTKPENFSKPFLVEEAFVCPGAGKLASRNYPGAYKEFFIRGTKPTEKCYEPKAQEVTRPEPRTNKPEDKKNEEQEDNEDSEPVEEKPPKKKPEDSDSPEESSGTEKPPPDETNGTDSTTNTGGTSSQQTKPSSSS